MAVNTAFTPNASDAIIDPTTGQFTEIGRRLVRTLSAAVGALAPVDAQYWTSTPAAALTAERNIGSLVSGYLKIVTAAGIATPSTAALIPVADISGLPTLTSGTYTPTLTNVANLSASTAFACQFLRVGAIVTVSGRVDVDPVAGATDTQLGISLPYASNFSNSYECAGSGATPTIAGQCAAIRADTVNDRATLQWLSGDITNQPLYFSFTFQVI